MKTIDASILYRPESPELSFLPEGPYSLGNGRISWVAIQHGADSTAGSVNILDLNTGQNKCHQLPGRPGFAFPTDQHGVFVAGVERQLGLFNTESGEWHVINDQIEDDVDGTIINDGIAFDGNLLFGCKDLQFKDAKAGLYLWRAHDRTLHKLRSDQTCSNGKARLPGGGLRIVDIDTPTKQIVEFELNLEAGSIGDPKVVVDLTSLEMFPDGMILTPDGRSIIVAFYNPNDADYGEARQYGLESGEVETVWRCEKSPQVTCPQLVRVGDDVKLVLTTAVEHMPPERQAMHLNAGCLFIGETEFSSIGEQPVFDVPEW
jgi:sugar lactone lactonase YvrE